MTPAPPDSATIAFAGRVFDAVRVGETAQVSELLAHGFPAGLANDKGDTLVMLAAYHGHAELVRALCRAGADASVANDRGQTPLGGAIFKGYAAVVDALIAGGAALTDAGPHGQTALDIATMFGRTELYGRLTPVT